MIKKAENVVFVQFVRCQVDDVQIWASQAETFIDLFASDAIFAAVKRFYARVLSLHGLVHDVELSISNIIGRYIDVLEITMI